ncbi:MAG TPA: hypothetical protein VGS41_16050, partial [Chthonomonadales bacterium]|nr:hypothetical protein [Chthonomonadales bacterium]
SRRRTLSRHILAGNMIRDNRGLEGRSRMPLTLHAPPTHSLPRLPIPANNLPFRRKGIRSNLSSHNNHLCRSSHPCRHSSRYRRAFRSRFRIWARRLGTGREWITSISMRLNLRSSYLARYACNNCAKIVCADNSNASAAEDRSIASKTSQIC